MSKSSDGSAAFKFPKLPLDAIAQDEERRERAKKNLVRALQSYVNKLERARDRNTHRETELFCDYARENYSSRAAPYFDVVPPVDPSALFRVAKDSERDDLSDLGELSGLPTIGDTLDLVKSIKVRRPKHWPDGPIFVGGETAEARRVLRSLIHGKHVSFGSLLESPDDNWFRQQIRECIEECVRDKRAAYEQRFPCPSAPTNPSSGIANLPPTIHSSVPAGSIALRFGVEPNPFLADQPSHEVWERLPREARETLARYSWEFRRDVLEFDKAFKAKFAEAANFNLLERYCLERFDLFADRLLIVSISADATSVNSKYESYLGTVQQECREYVGTVLRSVRSEARGKIISRISQKLSSQKLHWLHEGANWWLQGCPPRPAENVKGYVERLLGAVATGAGLDDFVQKIADELERKRGVDATPVGMSVRQPSWTDLRTDFLEQVEAHDDLTAVWRWSYAEKTRLMAIGLAAEENGDPGDVLRRMYRVQDASIRPPDPTGQWFLEGGSPTSQDLFRVIAGRAAARLPNPDKMEPWRLWLDHMRSEGYALELPARNKSGQALGSYPKGFEDLWIERVFKSSADFCFVRSIADTDVSPPSRASDERLATPAGGQPLSRSERWEDIEFFFIGDHDVEVRIGDGVQKLNYKEIRGFEDRRTGNPSQLWAIVRVFGSLPDQTMPADARTGQEWIALQKKIERASNALRKHFQITGDPFPYINNVGYRARIKIKITPPAAR